MKLKLETVLTGLLVGILLYCVCNQLFLVEGVCQRGCLEGQMCPHEKECPPSGCCDEGTTPPTPPTPPAPPTPAPPKDETCSKLKKETCLIDGDVKYGCVNTDSGQNDAQLGYVYSCNKEISTRQDCDKLRTPFKWCPRQNEPPPPPPPPPPSPCTSPISPPDDFLGYIQINNSTDKTITLWYDTTTGGGRMMTKRRTDGDVKFNDCVTPVEPNGYRMTPNSSLFIKFERGDEWESFGMWSTYNDIRGREVTGSRAAPRGRRR